MRKGDGSHGLDLVLRVHVDGMPQTKGSWRPVHRNGGCRLVPDNDLEPGWASAVAWSAKAEPEMRGKEPDGTRRFEVRLDFCLAAPPNKRRTNRRDLDKLARSVLDALTGIVWKDDEQVDSLVCSKRVVGDNENPGVEIWVLAYDFG